MGGKRMKYNFQERLNFSKGKRQESDQLTIMQLLDGCANVATTDVELDRLGVDYIATLRKGAEVYIDAKTREEGCSRFWKKNEPELAIEVWSVVPGGKYNTKTGRVGWTLDEAKITDMILYTFSESDCGTAYLFPFQSLRMATRRNVRNWMNRFKVDTQDSGSWESQAVFVPASEVIIAMETTYSSTI